MRDEAIDRVLQALLSGELRSDELTARRLSSLVGKTTSVLYHHFGSLDALLYEVGKRGTEHLVERLATGDRSFETLAEKWIDFALEAPELYELMFTRRFDWAALRAQGLLGEGSGLLWRAGVARFQALGRPSPEDDARVLFGGLHGLASLAISGRANVGDLTLSDRDAAIRAARHFIACFLEKP